MLRGYKDPELLGDFDAEEVVFTLDGVTLQDAHGRTWAQIATPFDSGKCELCGYWTTRGWRCLSIGGFPVVCGCHIRLEWKGSDHDAHWHSAVRPDDHGDGPGRMGSDQTRPLVAYPAFVEDSAHDPIIPQNAPGVESSEGL